MHFRFYILWLAPLAMLAGCHASEKREPKVVAPIAAAAESSAPIKPKTSASPAPTPADPKVTSAHTNEFKPPFPERTELFDPPKRALSTVRRDDEHGQSVELKGFITVDQPRVVLSIDGVISPIPEGGEKFGVHVISIQPPKAVLQRGRNRWVATLE